MTKTLPVMLMAAAIGLATTATAEAAITVTNATSRSVWVTIYNAVGQGIYSGCLRSGARLPMGGGVGTATGPGASIYVRGELKEQVGCGGRTLSDTGRGMPVILTNDTRRWFAMGGNTLNLTSVEQAAPAQTN